MLTIEQLKERLAEDAKRGRLPVVSQESGVAYWVVRKLRASEVKNVRSDNYMKLVAYYERPQ